MRLKRNNKRTATQIATLLLGLGLAGAGIVSTICQVMAITPSEVYAKTYIQDPFNANYSKGVLYYGNPGASSIIGHGTGNCTRTKDNITYNFYCGNNSEISDDIYIEIKGGAIYNNELLDVHEHLAIVVEKLYSGFENADVRWGFNKETAQMGIASNNNDDYNGKGEFYVTRQIRFFKDGTEVEFKGVIAYSDFEPPLVNGTEYYGIGEGYTINNGLVQAYATNPTILTAGSNRKSWYNANFETYGTEWDTAYVLWTEVQGNKNSRLELKYQAPLIGRFTSNKTESSKVSYYVNGEKISKEDIVVKYGTLTPTAPTDIPTGVVFDGWYKDAEMTPTNKVTGSITVPGDMNLYGKYVEVEKAKVTTSIENGTIDESKDNIEPGTNYTVNYRCNDGYTLSTIKVDGANTDTATHPTSYTFTEIPAGDHTVSVVCVKEEKAKVTTSIENGTIDKSKDDIDPGIDYTVKYKCNEGYTLNSLTVDNKATEIANYPNSYTFIKLPAGNHAVSVICTKAETPNTGSINSSSYGGDSTTNGGLNITSLLVSSLISIAGFALIHRFIRHNKAMSFKK